MKHRAFVALLLFVLGILSVGVYLRFVSRAPSPEVPSDIPSLPAPSPTTPVPTDPSSVPITVSGRHGPIQVHDFLGSFTRGPVLEGVSSSDPYDEYYVLSDASTSPSYQIVYWPFSKSFLISLLERPLGVARVNAERALINVLGLEQERLCDLSVSVRVDKFADEGYAGTEVGLSSCAGAIPLADL